MGALCECCVAGGEDAGGAQWPPAALYALSTNEKQKVAGTFGPGPELVAPDVGSVEWRPVPLPSASREAMPLLEWPPDGLAEASGSL